jgi:hypothetical protein
VIIQWQPEESEGDRKPFHLVVVNLAGHSSQCYVDLVGGEISQHSWHVTDLLGTEVFVREGTKLKQQGLFLDSPAHGAQLFQIRPQ